METKAITLFDSEGNGIYSMYGPKSGVGGVEVQLSEADIKKVRRAERAHDKAQDIMRAAMAVVIDAREQAATARRLDPDHED